MGIICSLYYHTIYISFADIPDDYSLHSYTINDEGINELYNLFTFLAAQIWSLMKICAVFLYNTGMAIKPGSVDEGIITPVFVIGSVVTLFALTCGYRYLRNRERTAVIRMHNMCQERVHHVNPMRFFWATKIVFIDYYGNVLFIFRPGQPMQLDFLWDEIRRLHDAVIRLEPYMRDSVEGYFVYYLVHIDLYWTINLAIAHFRRYESVYMWYEPRHRRLPNTNFERSWPDRWDIREETSPFIR